MLILDTKMTVYRTFECVKPIHRTILGVADSLGSAYTDRYRTADTSNGVFVATYDPTGLFGVGQQNLFHLSVWEDPSLVGLSRLLGFKPIGIDVLTQDIEGTQKAVRQVVEELGLRKLKVFVDGLYCQNPLCEDPMIEEGRLVGVIDGRATHSELSCVQNYLRAHNDKDTLGTFSVIPYDDAIAMAEQGQLIFEEAMREIGLVSPLPRARIQITRA